MAKRKLENGMSVASLAESMGHSPDTVWNHEANEPARKRLRDVNTTTTDGDILVEVPAITPAEGSGQTGGRITVTVAQTAEVRCPFCTELIADCDREWDRVPGNHIGVGTTLRASIWRGRHADHPWWIADKSCQAHHLICSETMNSQDWSTVCRSWGYDINRAENGVMLPAIMGLACHLGVPLHRGNHGSTTPHYPTKVDGLIQDILQAAMTGEYCTADGCERLRADLDELSVVVLDKVKAFVWPLTADGADYQPGRDIGCGGLSSISDKPRSTATCPKQRDHGSAYRHPQQGVLGCHRSSPPPALQVGDAHFANHLPASPGTAS